MTTLGEWRDLHTQHGRGPWRDSRQHLWDIYRCSCGVRFYVQVIEAAQGNAAPGIER